MLRHTESCLPTPQAILRLNLDVIVTPSGNCISAKTRNKTILDDLVDRGFIEPYHAEYGLTFTILRQVWLGRLSASTAMLSDAIQSQCPQNSPSEVYDHVYRITKPMNARIVFWAVNTPSEALTAMVGDVCRRSFDILAQAFTDTHKLLAERKEVR